MVKTTFAALASAVLSASFAQGINYNVASCADLAAVDDTTVTSLTITSSPIACEEYTRFRVRNTMTLSSTLAEVEFDNVAMKVLGELTVEPDVIFKGVTSQVRAMPADDDGRDTNTGCPTNWVPKQSLYHVSALTSAGARHRREVAWALRCILSEAFALGIAPLKK